MVLNEAAVDVRSTIVVILASWAALVVDERGVVGPGQRDIRWMVSFLLQHVDWLAAHPAALDFVSEIVELGQVAREVIHPNPVLRLELGPCAQSGCGQMVRAVVRADDEVSPPLVGCDGGHVSSPRQWLLLGRRMARARREPAEERWESGAGAGSLPLERAQ
jgi:hypothetical protein